MDKHYVMLKDGAAMGLSAIARQAKENGTLVILSGIIIFIIFVVGDAVGVIVSSHLFFKVVEEMKL